MVILSTVAAVLASLLVLSAICGRTIVRIDALADPRRPGSHGSAR